MDFKIAHPDYMGMTLNQRLFHAGLTDRFDEAARNRDSATMTHILKSVALTEIEAHRTIRTILADPKKYGY